MNRLLSLLSLLLIPVFAYAGGIKGPLFSTSDVIFFFWGYISLIILIVQFYKKPKTDLLLFYFSMQFIFVNFLLVIKLADKHSAFDWEIEYMGGIFLVQILPYITPIIGLIYNIYHHKKRTINN